MNSERIDDVLKELIELLEDPFGARYIKPRVITLTEFDYFNDETEDKAGEQEDDETLVLSDWRIENVSSFSEVDHVVPIIATDAASVKIGETDRGIISAIRISIVGKSVDEEIKVLKLGPYVVHITEENKDDIYNYFREYFGVPEASPPALRKMPDRFRNFLERMAQRSICAQIENGIVLWDGSLTAGTIDTPRKIIDDSLDVAKRHGNSVVGVSKNSWLRLEDGTRIISLLDNVSAVGYIKVDRWISSSLRSRIRGNVFAVKFTEDGFTFRVDINPAEGISSEHVLNLLRSNVSFYNGYPYLLRLAHINAYFTPNEILAIQSYVADKFNLIFVRPFDVRRHILSPF
ncbi:MAG: DNA double-strand break repair nuclease NurA [Candidatus Asgardarchaeum sp.]